MTIAQVRKLYEAWPFKPFRLKMAAGHSVVVPHPEWMSFSPSGRTIIVHHRDDDYDVIDLLLVTALKVESNGKTKGNGSKRH